MNLFVYFLFRILNSYCTKSESNPEIVVLYEYNSKFDVRNRKDDLYKIELSYNWEKKYEFLLNSSIQKPFFNHDKSKRYEHLPDNMSKEIVKNTAAAANIVYFQAYNFIFANTTKKEKRSFKTYVTGGPHGLENDSEYIYSYHIEKIIRSFLDNRLFIVKDFCSGAKRDDLLNRMNFDLQFFKSYSACIGSLDNFLDFLNCFKLVKDDSNTKSKTSSGRKENLITISQLRNLLKTKLDDYLNDINGKNDFYNAFHSKSNSSGPKIYKILCEHLENRLLLRDVLLPIFERGMSINSFIQLFFNRILSVTKNYMSYRIGGKNDEVILNENLKKDLNVEIDELSKENIDKIFNNELDFLCFSFVYKSILCIYHVDKNLFLIELEKLICDYYNTIECIMNKDKENLIVYIEPILFRKTCHRFVKALEIKLPDDCKKIKCIRFFDSSGEEKILETQDYIFTMKKLYLMFNVIKEYNIERIRIFVDNNNFMKEVDVDKYSRLNMDSAFELRYDETSACTIA